jgi:phosphohistidine phosphatase
MNIFLLRHGLAVEFDAANFASDFDRPLTAEGARAVARVAKAMKAMRLSFDRILSSPYVRARQTAEIAVKVLRVRKKLALTDTLAPDGSPEELIALLQRLKPAPGNVLLAGHEPYLSDLVSLLVWGKPGAAVTMKKGGLCKLSCEPPRAERRRASLEWLLTPKQMMRMK